MTTMNKLKRILEADMGYCASILARPLEFGAWDAFEFDKELTTIEFVKNILLRNMARLNHEYGKRREINQKMFYRFYSREIGALLDHLHERRTSVEREFGRKHGSKRSSEDCP